MAFTDHLRIGNDRCFPVCVMETDVCWSDSAIPFVTEQCSKLATMMDHYQQDYLLYYAVLRRERAQRRRARSCWMKQWPLSHQTHCHMPLLMEIRENNPDDYHNVLRMDDATFQELLPLVTSYIEKQDTNFGPHHPVLLIVKVLQYQYCKFPTSMEEWKAIAEEFAQRWNFPNCGGAIDGKHVRISQPVNSGSYYYTYKGYFSIVLMAVGNANYEFIFLDVSRNRCASYGGTLNNTKFYQRLTSNTLHLPSDKKTKHVLNFVFVADEAFALYEHIMKPYAQKGLNHDKRIFNYRLSRARCIVESALGILANCFRIFNTAINLRVDKIDLAVTACCVLLNLLHRRATQQRATGTEPQKDPDLTVEVCRYPPWNHLHNSIRGLHRPNRSGTSTWPTVF
ncbi:uncharacterized protein LOC135009520 [Pseudophryne corroboree]|uniref:uncharacterized protein LOC135009520 n=1 Tax=Pseudophryne corroboree TaxID=495146 RepID=UPI0030819E38